MTTLQVQNGDVIRGYDFKPMIGREDCFVEGEVLDRNDNTNGYQAYKIRVTREVFSGEKVTDNLVGKVVYVPWKVSFMEYQGRVMNLSR